MIRFADLVRVLPRVEFWDDRDIILDEDDSFDPRIATLSKAHIAVFEGWRLRSHKQIFLSRPKILDAFRPRPEVVEKVSERIQRAREHGDKVLGVHIRWEDYRGSEMFFSSGSMQAISRR